MSNIYKCELGTSSSCSKYQRIHHLQDAFLPTFPINQSRCSTDQRMSFTQDPFQFDSSGIRLHLFPEHHGRFQAGESWPIIQNKAMRGELCCGW
ncbi:hypothetical protein BS47DRAFT_1205201 [Hydnum rufescens UP504]|uniref:Uncharacterized protein n=1 Tax=Hydnum rufescens UP504 TaxID=1448309 RepID=A0A9P6DTZ3_9AGAM|nr:hypothetical protein BS47DRAFT_1205201 [Hydnum rufescens UP504]